jgi:excisionase family DNA binding protein
MGTKSTCARRYLTRSEVARLFEVAPATVTRWSREGKLPCVRTLGGQRRYLRDQVTRLASLTGPERKTSSGLRPSPRTSR